MAKPIRTVLTRYRGPGIVFAVERWLYPLDQVEESVARYVLIFSDADDQGQAVLDGTQRIVMLSSEAAKDVAKVLAGDSKE